MNAWLPAPRRRSDGQSSSQALTRTIIDPPVGVIVAYRTGPGAGDLARPASHLVRSAEEDAYLFERRLGETNRAVGTDPSTGPWRVFRLDACLTRCRLFLKMDFKFK